MDQKEVTLLGFRCENHNILKIIELTPDLLSKQLIQIVGESGNGKSSLIDALMLASAGTDAIKKKDALLPGFEAEVQLLDGEIKLFVGARKREITRGQRTGEYEFETYLYAKDDQGKQYTPIIDGEVATAAKYMKLLTTDLTFNMADFFTENQPRHRTLIEKLFKDELAQLGAEDTIKEMIATRGVRDEARMMCQRTGAFMEQLEKEGYTEAMLAAIEEVDIAAIEKRLQDAAIERDRILNPAGNQHELECERIRNTHQQAVSKLREQLAAEQKKESDDFQTRSAAYFTAKQAYDQQEVMRTKYNAIYDILTENIEKYFGKDIEGAAAVQTLIDRRKDVFAGQFSLMEPEEVRHNAEMIEAIRTAKANLDQFESAELVFPSPPIPDTTAIDKQIEKLKSDKEEGVKMNQLRERYQTNKTWLETKAKYEAVVDDLRRTYARVQTGVEGLKIVPVDTNTDKVEVWLQYDGSYDVEFFQNPKLESRYIFSYSSFQRSAIGVMLQAARLNLKPKALRLAIVDDVAFTAKGLAVLSGLCKSLNIKLITSRTDDITKEQVKDGEVLMVGGEAFFKQ
jgi:hypothetical protein